MDSLDDEEKSFVLRCVGIKSFFCGFESCRTRECFNTWKHVQQHYKNYHKVTIKKKDQWNEEIPRIIEIDKADPEEDMDVSTKNRLKRKRAARTNESFKVQKNLENESNRPTMKIPESESINKFTMLLSNSSVLAKLTKDISLLKEQIQNAVLTEHQDPTVVSCVNVKLGEFTRMKQTYEKSIESCRKTNVAFTGAQKEMIDQLGKVEGKELFNSIVFAKFLLNSLLLSELMKNPEYIALLALHDILESY